uniref:CCHC-type domain-containing protein n=1 Tax=Leptobrachium leishanense TaxID=445787 RepID=A0A8C5N2U2_9ANUR
MAARGTVAAGPVRNRPLCQHHWQGLGRYGQTPPSRNAATVRWVSDSPRQHRTPKQKIPFATFKLFPEGSEDIDGFLQDFERQCALQEVAAQDWVPLRASKLTGRAAEAYRAVADEDCMVYERVKEHLLARYALTPEAYRDRFRALKKGTHDSYVEWGHRMQQVVRSWIQGCQATHPDQIIQLLLLEQFYNYSPPEVRNWVRDRHPLTLPEDARLADEYQDARRVPPPDIRPPPPRFHPAPQPRTAPIERAPRPLTIHTPVPRTGPRCYGCNQIGHIRDRCPLTANRPAPHRPAHPPGRATAYCGQHEPEPEPTAIPDEDWGILHEADPIQAAAQDNWQHHRQKVRVNGRSANGLRDTGATLTLAQPHLITRAASTGYSVAVRVAGGHVYRIPTARVHLDWGTDAWDVEVGIMKDLPTIGLRKGSTESTQALTPLVGDAEQPWVIFFTYGGNALSLTPSGGWSMMESPPSLRWRWSSPLRLTSYYSSRRLLKICVNLRLYALCSQLDC